jgi:hypothetical protein
MAEKDLTTEPVAKDFSCEIAMELNQLRALGDILMETDTPEYADDTLHGLGLLIRGIGERIEKMTEATYLACINKGKMDPQAAAQEDFDLDPVTKENIFKDAEKLQDMASQIQLAAEGLCHDLGLELPPNIKERIARQKAARQAAA